LAPNPRSSAELGPTGLARISRKPVDRGLTHRSFLVDDVDRAAQRLTRYGATIVDGTRSKPGIDIVFLADLNGFRVVLMAR
jgi:hypothetical protein